VTGFDNPLETWNARYAREDFHFGEGPNAFVRAHARDLRPGDTSLCVADGEGRNSVFLAERGLAVTAFDFSPNAIAKARALALRRGVQVEDADLMPRRAQAFDQQGSEVAAATRHQDDAHNSIP